jgi:iron complex outermembrane receptor protein
VVVREITNGNYDIHLRGFDNLIRYTQSYAQTDILTLVMIDDRPVFNYNTGGTVWESLPIGLVDVERIEIVRGPAAPLFGPNAVTGVINIITRRPEQPGLYASAHTQYGDPSTRAANVAVGSQFSDRWSATVSANYQYRERGDDAYYVYAADQYVGDLEAIGVPFAQEAYPRPQLALEKFGANSFLTYQPNEQASWTLSAGVQGAEAQRLYYNFDATALNTSTINRQYVQLNGRLNNLGIRASHASGSDNLYVGFGLIRPEYDVRNTDVVVDYRLKLSNKLSLRPELSFQRAVLDDRPYTSSGAIGFVNKRVSNYTAAGSLKADYRPIPGWRLIAALRVDKFKVPDRAYVSYQLATTYKINDRYLLRAAQSRSTSGAFFNSYFIDVPLVPTSLTEGVIFVANPDLDVVSNTMTEVGVRVQANSTLQFDVAVFRQQIQDLSYPYVVTRVPLTENFTVESLQSLNLPTKATQTGVTLSVNYVPSAQLQIKPFVTGQATRVMDLPTSLAAGFPSVIDDTHRSTPSFYGGAFINYAPYRKLNVNVSTYFFDQHTVYHVEDLRRPSTAGQIDGKLLTNAKVSYEVAKKLDVYVNGRNLLGNDSREYYGTDRIGRMLLGGVSYNF